MKKTGLIQALLMGALTLAVLLVFRSLQQTGDSLSYATAIQTGRQMFHPHHLLYAPLARLVYLVCNGLGLAVDGILAGQIHNALWAAVAVAAATLLGERWSGIRLCGLATGSALLSCQGFLLFATQVEVYVPALGCAALLLLVLQHEQGSVQEKAPAAARPGPAWSTALAGAALALMIFYHQTNVLFCLPLTAFLLLKHKSEGWRRAATIIGPAGLVVLGTYILVYTVQDANPSLSGFIRFNLRYALAEQWAATGNLSGQGLTAALAAQMQALVRIPASWAMVAGRLAGGTLLLLLAWNALAVSRRIVHAPFRLLLLVWLITYAAFFLWWQPGQDEFFVITLLPLILLVMLMLNDLGERFHRWPWRPVLGGTLAGALLLMLLPWHISAGMMPAHQGPGSEYEEARQVMAINAAGCTIAVRRQVMHAARYYFGVEREASYNVTRVQKMLLAGRAAEVPPLPPETCVLTPLRDLQPGAMARQNPQVWLRYITWLLRLGPGQDDDVMLMPEIHLLKDAAGRPYIRQSAARHAVAGLAQACVELDAALTRDTGIPAQAFSSWYENQHHALQGPGLHPMNMPQAEPGPGGS